MQPHERYFPFYHFFFTYLDRKLHMLIHLVVTSASAALSSIIVSHGVDTTTVTIYFGMYDNKQSKQAKQEQLLFG
jgi:hypothetical protein